MKNKKQKKKSPCKSENVKRINQKKRESERKEKIKKMQKNEE